MIINVLKTFYSLVFLNFKIVVLKFFFKKKIFFFYHPITTLTKIHTFYIEDLFNNIGKNIAVFFGCQPHDKIKLKLGRNYYFIKQGFLKLVFNVDIFVSLNPCDVFTNNSIKVYMHHNIYDGPLAPKKKEKVLLTQLSKYDHIFLSSKQTFTVFTELFKTNLKKPLFHEAGYPRLDYLIKKKKNLKIKKTVIIAPTNFKSVPNLTMQKHISEIIFFFIKSKKYEVMYRPHPSNAKEIKVLNIEKKFKNNPHFKLDISNDYFKVYNYNDFTQNKISYHNLLFIIKKNKLYINE